jgi:DNA-dependent RNA polymerase auxiliary subunit epsilon
MTYGTLVDSSVVFTDLDSAQNYVIKYLQDYSKRYSTTSKDVFISEETIWLPQAELTDKVYRIQFRKITDNLWNQYDKNFSSKEAAVDFIKHQTLKDTQFRIEVISSFSDETTNVTYEGIE